jgi:hypothetical protein
MPRFRSHSLALLALALALALAGCGDEPTGGARRKGEVSAQLIDDPGSPAPIRVLPRSGASFSTARAAIPSGTVTVEATVTLLTDQGGGEELVPEAGGATVDLGSTSKTPVARADVSTIRYSMARITFTRVVANVSGGLVVGQSDLVGTVSVSLAQPAVLERPIELAVVENGHHELEIDLNAESWLTAVDPVSRTVPSAAFRSAVTIQARQ